MAEARRTARRLLGLVVVAGLLSACGTTSHAANNPAADHNAAGPPGSPSASPSPTAPGDLPPDVYSRIPHFPAPPAAQPVTVPPGPSAGWYSSIPTDKPIAFITMDDGWEKNPLAPAMFRAAHVPITLFLEINAIKDNPDYFKPLVAAGATIEAHTISHPELKGKSYAAQHHEICDGADKLQQYYGTRPTLFRPPFGDKDATTLKVVHDCGMKAAFFWKETTDKGKVFFQSGTMVKPGDIILMHFRPAFVNDFLAVLKAVHDAGLTPARLEDYIA
jgi:peptidoglycan/xylan/chitin deacetylase (PgdA/CDA1 family)